VESGIERKYVVNLLGMVENQRREEVILTAKVQCMVISDTSID